MKKIVEKIVGYKFGNFDFSEIENIAQEARVIQLQRYGNNLDEQAKVHISTIAMEAARNLRLLSAVVNFGKRKSLKLEPESDDEFVYSDRVTVGFASIDEMSEVSGFEPAFTEAEERPEIKLERVLTYVPNCKLKELFSSMLSDQASSIEEAAGQLNLTPQRVFEALRSIGKLVTRYEALSEGLFSEVCDDSGLRDAIARICYSLTPPAVCFNTGKQQSLNY